MNLEVIIEKLDGDISVPLDKDNSFQVRSDGILLNGNLHFWEEILWVNITNKELIKKLQANEP